MALLLQVYLGPRGVAPVPRLRTSYSVRNTTSAGVAQLQVYLLAQTAGSSTSSQLLACL